MVSIRSLKFSSQMSQWRKIICSCILLSFVSLSNCVKDQPKIRDVARDILAPNTGEWLQKEVVGNVNSFPNTTFRSTDLVRHKNLAVVRTFCPNDIDDLVVSFDDWNKFTPCRESHKKENYSADVFLIFSQNLSESKEAMDAIAKLYEIFKATNGWNGCFENIYAIDVNIESSMDLYLPSEQMENAFWVNGPNRQFERSIRAVQQSVHGEYECMYLMEGDSVPVKKFWLDELMGDVKQNRPFAILGRYVWQMPKTELLSSMNV